MSPVFAQPLGCTDACGTGSHLSDIVRKMRGFRHRLPLLCGSFPSRWLMHRNDACISTPRQDAQPYLDNLIALLCAIMLLAEQSCNAYTVYHLKRFAASKERCLLDNTNTDQNNRTRYSADQLPCRHTVADNSGSISRMYDRAKLHRTRCISKHRSILFRK
ncbi:hypothetical protein BAUCODRAFT_393836 [Baudoinia panamericana UAMH 10762]|uniref:Uncharacterized protein n=1 Tax=Baudoinia panamericana (strain UAMH 10762) TaxID=717646 RepID=M2LWV3_BAUPA|nr:uncharacterized protein BAUCODRAFT_393836 [Baudoinia panamericana UAMH 10762]EMC99157.1 hypothetical protein BAUCODRAFT_393836 [Baudoinia panamericana UAMH 10762]